MYVYLLSCCLLMFNICLKKTTLYSYIDDSYVSLLCITMVIFITRYSDYDDWVYNHQNLGS